MWVRVVFIYQTRRTDITECFLSLPWVVYIIVVVNDTWDLSSRESGRGNSAFKWFASFAITSKKQMDRHCQHQ